MTRSATRRHFDKVAAEYYERNYDTPRTRHARALALRQQICLELLAGTGNRVLDLGCGPGALAVPLAREGRFVIAYDLSPRMVAEARRLIGATERGGFCVGDVASLPFASAAFDAVVTTGVLEYVPDVTRALGEIVRVLRPGGTLVATVTLPRRLERVVTRVVGPLLMRFKGGATIGGDVYQKGFTSSEFDRLIGDANLVIDVRRFSCFAPFPFDALFPPLVTALDRKLGTWLEGVEMATARAKTYVIRATRP